MNLLRTEIHFNTDLTGKTLHAEHIRVFMFMCIQNSLEKFYNSEI